MVPPASADQSGDRADHRRLARPVRPDEHQRLARLHRERQIVHDAPRAAIHDEMFNRQAH